ncbi:restriction endonuclease subunit S [Halobacillus litoralis]|uniref:restriction endonuclease subunit S n=1 Tax=Halobacillus litoralis TaxID=45668 RepID=UPI00249110A2|nr:restriction endonuclease subunit S [Halobacillus litoralis]
MIKRKKNIEKTFQKEVIREGPYKLPENWLWVSLSSSKKDKQSFGDGDWILKKNIDNNGTIRLLQLSDIGRGKFLNKSSKFISEDTFHELGCNEILPGDILISRMADPIARSCIISDMNQKLITAVDVAYLRPNQKLFDKKYLNFLFNSSFFRAQAEKEARGTTRLRITRKNLGNLPIPLPPINEQKRIVDRVERFMNKIDEARHLIKEAKDSFELRRKSILNKAFNGKLTEQWRKNNVQSTALEEIKQMHKDRMDAILSNKGRKPEYLKYDINEVVQEDNNLPETWVVAPVGFLCDSLVPGRTKPKSFTGSIPWVTIPDLVSDEIFSNQNGFLLTQDEIDTVKAKVIPENSVIMSCVGRFGISSVVKQPLVINQQLHAFLPSELILSRYLMYNIRHLDRYMHGIATSTTISYLNKTNANSLPISVSPLEEQKVIVDTLDSIFEKLNEHEVKLNDIDKYLENLEQSILTKAFKGELGTNDPKEESAIEMLKEAIQEQVN